MKITTTDLFKYLNKAVEFKGDIEVHAIFETENDCYDKPVVSVSIDNENKALILNTTDSTDILPLTASALGYMALNASQALSTTKVVIKDGSELMNVDLLELDGQSGQLCFNICAEIPGFVPDVKYRERYELFNSPDVFKHYRS